MYAIIDCFEIQIEKPTNAVHQALTYSDYKKCNTVKFLLCITPDGLVIFISEGYGGRISDIQIFEDSSLLNILPSGTSLMADRRFKGIATILNTKKINLVRPPFAVSERSENFKR